MADVFISYKSERRPAAKHLASIIEAHGFSVWFDYDLVPGKNFGKAIEAELRQAKAAVVLWCSKSIGSEWVREEADLAKKLGIFVPARIELCEPPLGFRLDDFVDISSWDGDPSTRSLDRLIDRIETLVGRESMIARRKLVELHQSWSTLGRPTLARFALASKREIADEDRRLPSSVREAAAPTPSPIAVSTGHDYAFWERQWDKHASGENLVALRIIVEEAPRFFAEQAKARIVEISTNKQTQAEEEPNRRIAEKRLKAELDEMVAALAVVEHHWQVDEYRAEGRIKVDAKFNHGAPADPGGGGWFRPGAGKTEWFKDLDIGPEMVVVPAGEFMMGSADGEGVDDERPRHKVTMAAPLAVGRFVVTFDEWDATVAAGGVAHKPDDLDWGRGRRPAINISWDDAKAYCAWLSAAAGKAYRLLSEAEWEYCCRATSSTSFWWGSDISTAKANYDGNYTYNLSRKGEYRRRTTSVDSFEPNPWGLYQVHGNVWEWCEDSWHVDYVGAPTDGSVWLAGGDRSRRVLRGGSWYSHPDDLRSAYRDSNRPGQYYDVVGFRVARTL